MIAEQDHATWQGRAGRTVAVTLLVIVACAALVGWRWTSPGTVAQADTWWYARGALVLTGVPSAEAERRATAFLCTERASATPASGCAERAVSNPRYARIFTTRPGYPLLAATLVAPLGLGNALRAVTATAAVGTGLFLFFAVRRSGSGIVGGAAAIAGFFLLPSGFWATRLLTDGVAMLGLACAIWSMLTWLDGRRRGLVALVVSLALIYVVKSPDGVALSLAMLALGGLAALVGPRPTRRAFAWIAIIGVLTALTGWAVSLVLGLPGLTETIQDLATKHFSRPDVARPLAYLRFEDLKLLGWFAGQLPSQALGWVTALVGLATLVVRRRWLAVPWLAVGCVGVAAVVAHPLVSEVPRLLCTVCFPVAAGLGLLVDAVWRRSAGARATVARPAVPAEPST
jgi:hypothetical protein